ncbi:MAG TPA: aldehyde dehydrogenase family protein [Anaerolineales bacterium]|nr:aldehyde dehydrogenase family protein [Anaerolineales bacterium]HRQ91305.1 aldehyde dehydrogenase family protein [Anaerolineales bacterium]
MTLPNYNFQPATLKFLEDSPKKLFINNEWVAPQSGETFATRNPANGAVLAEVALANAADVDAAVAAAQAAFPAWASMIAGERGALLFKLADLIDQHADVLAELETLDNGKPIRVARRGDLPYVTKHLRYQAGWADKIEGSTVPVTFADQFVYTRREPLGVVGAIIPWNFPLLMAIWKLGPALAAGNTLILKPAEQTPLTALYLAELAREAGFPPGVLNVLTGPGLPTGAAMAEHAHIAKLAFTGSTSVGARIMEAAAKSNLKRVSLELGGKSPNVIFADADMNAAIRGAQWAVFSTAGQECVAGTRLFVQRAVYDQVLEGLTANVGKMVVDHGFAEKVHVGPLISAEQLERVAGYIDEGKKAGAEILAGGERLGDGLKDGYFLKPTVFSYSDDSLRLVQEEIFGPVAAVTAFDDEDELIARSNATQFGLAAGVWTRDIGKAHRYAHAVQAGTVWINGYGMIDPAAPFGGYKMSGFGREMGKEAIDLYTQVKTVWVSIE